MRPGFRCVIGVMCSVASVGAVQRDAHAQTESRNAELACDALSRMAINLLRELPNPSPAEYELTALALRVARRERPNDEELCRLELEAWNAADRQDEVLALTREIVRLDPKDTVAWLRLVSDRIGRLQSADERLEAYERLLASGASTLDESVLSRLALDASLLAREMGDEERFVELLTDATLLDVTNKDAAALYATYFLPLAADPVTKAELLGNLVLSDPTDPVALTNLGMELMRGRAYAGALRFLDRAGDIYLNTGIRFGPDDYFDRIFASWMANGDERALALILELRNQQQMTINYRRRERMAMGLDPGPEVTARVPPNIEILRLAIAFGRGDAEMQSASVEFITSALEEEILNVQTREPPFDRATSEERANIVLASKLQLMVAQVWGGSRIDDAERTLDELTDAPDQSGLEPDAIRRTRGWIALRRGTDQLLAEQIAAVSAPRMGALLSGDPGALAGASVALAPDTNEHLARARTLLEPLASGDPFAKLGLALLEESEGNTQQAVRLYAGLALENGDAAIGASARRRAELLLGSQIRPDADARALEAFAQAFAPWLEDLTASPRRFMQLTAEHVQRDAGPLDRILVRIRLRNISPHPLAMGPQAPINSELMLNPRVTLIGRPPSNLEEPEVVDFDRRLRLLPDESVTVDFWANRGRVGLLLQLSAHVQATLRWQLLQGYRVDTRGRYSHGSMCVVTETGLLSRSNLRPAENADEVIARLGAVPMRSLASTILLAAVSGVQSPEGISPKQDEQRRGRISQAIVDRWHEMDPHLRAFAACVALRGGLVFPGSPLENQLRLAEHPIVRAAALTGALRVSGGDAALGWIESGDPDVARMAALVAEPAGDGAP